MRARGMVTPGTAAITTNSGARRRANARAGGPKMRARSCSGIGSSRAGGACNWGRDRTSARVRHAGGPRLECKAWRRSGSTSRPQSTPAMAGEPPRGLGSGLSDMELALRLRYEIRREFAPYIGVTWNRAFGATADFRRTDGEGIGDARVVAGVRAWF